MRSSFSSSRLCGVVVVGLVLRLAAVAAAAGAGGVRGVVSNGTSGDRLEGVNVEAVGASVGGGRRTTLTNRAGRYELQGLPPGPYLLSFFYPGTEPTTREVEIRQGESITLDVGYSLQMDELRSLSLVERRRLTRPDSTQTGSLREIRNANRLPTGRTYLDLARRIPGATGSDEDRLIIKGGTGRMNRFLIDGLDVSDPETSFFGEDLSFDATESVEVITGGMDAEYNALGGIVNVLTRGGSDEFHAHASVYVNRASLTARGSYGTSPLEWEQPLAEGELEPYQSYEVSLGLAGPLVKQKLWYAATYQLTYEPASTERSPSLGVPPYNVAPPDSVSRQHAGHLRLSYAPAPGHRVWLSASGDPGINTNTFAGRDRLGVAENLDKQRGLFSVAGWEWVANDHLTSSLQAGFLYSYDESGPMGWFGEFDRSGCEQFSSINCVYDRNRPQHTNLFDNTVWHQGDPYHLDRRYRVQISPSLRIQGTLGGLHNLKAGVQAQMVRHRFKSVVPGGSVYTDDPSTPLEGGLCDPARPGPSCYMREDSDPFETQETGYAIGLYLQDRWWTPLRWLTINPGLRFDFGLTQDQRGRTVTSLNGLAPRLGFTVDLTRDGRNIFFGHYGRATDPMSLLIASDSASEATRDRTYRFNQTTRTWDQISESGGPAGAIIDRNPKMPRTDEVTFGVRRELFPSTVGTAEYTWKKVSHDWAVIEQNRIWDPSGARVVAYVDPTKEGREVYLHTTAGNARRYQGLVLATEGQPTPNWDCGVSYTLSWATFQATADNPRLQQFSRGYSDEDVRHFIRLHASYNFTPSLTAGGFFNWRSGSPITKKFFNAEDGSFDNRRSPAGTAPAVPNDPAAFSAFRLPDMMELDLRLTYDVLPERLKHSLLIIVDVFNLLNQATPTAIETADLEGFGQVFDRQTPRRIQLAMRYSY